MLTSPRQGRAEKVSRNALRNGLEAVARYAPQAQFCYLEPIYQEVTPKSSPAPGWQSQGWDGACSGTGPCALTTGQNHSVSATFIRVSPPNYDFAASQPICDASASVSGTTEDSTRESGESNHCLNSSADYNGTTGFPWPGDHTVWYKAVGL